MKHEEASKILLDEKEKNNRIEQLSSKIMRQEKFDNLDDLKKQYQSLPAISKKQYEQLPKEQRQEYIKVLETITSKLSANILSVNQEIDFLLKGSQNSNQQDLSFITLQAMQMAIDTRKIIEKQTLDKMRSELELKKPIDLLFKRTNFKLKCYKLEKDTKLLEIEKRNFKEMGKEQFKVLPFIWNNFSDYIWIKLIVLLKYYDREWSSICNDTNIILENGTLLSDGNEKFKNYKLEECLIFLTVNGDETEYKRIKRYKYSIDIEMEEMRKKKIEQEQKIENYNKNLKEKWNNLKDLDKLKFYIKEDSRKDYDEILKKAKIIGLEDNGIIELFIDERKENTFFLPSFDSKTFQSKIPLLFMDPLLEIGFHNQSFNLAKQWNVPESIITELYNKRAIMKENIVDLLDISKFKKIFYSELKIEKSSFESILTPQPKL